MKKIILTLVVAAVIGMSANAQVMKKGDQTISFGIGLPDVSGSIRLPALSAIWDLGVTDKLGIGYISGGAQFTMSGGKYEYWGWKETTTNYIVGARAAYHFDFLDISGSSSFEKLDIYAGFFLGVNIVKEKDTDTISDISTTDAHTYFKEDVFAGIRYSFSDVMSVYGEVGYNIAYISGGISLRF